jgi:nucleotide-binding universal stress UspA family protein
MERIVVATDGSAGAARAVDIAARLAARDGAALWLVNVIDDHEFSSEQLDEFRHAEHVSLATLLTSLSAQVLMKAEDSARAAGAKTVHLESRYGDAATVILELIAEKHADAVVLGRRGRGRLAAVLLGSVSQKIASLAPCIVMIVP